MNTELFIGTKLIKAQAMTRKEYNDYRKWDLPEDEDGTDAGYLVEYLDGGKPNHPNHKGYISWSPVGVFNNAYKASGEMSFGAALELMKTPNGVLKGYKVARSGWNGKGMCLMLIHPTANDQYSIIEKDGIAGTLAPYIAMKTADNQLVPWLASQTDVIAEDWLIVG